MTLLIVGSVVAGAGGVYLALPQPPARGERVRRGVGAALALGCAVLLSVVPPGASAATDDGRWLSDMLRDLLAVAGLAAAGTAIVAASPRLVLAALAGLGLVTALQAVQNSDWWLCACGLAFAAGLAGLAIHLGNSIQRPADARRSPCTEPLLACLAAALLGGSLVAVMHLVFEQEIPAHVWNGMPEAYDAGGFQQSLIAASLLCALGLVGLVARRGAGGILTGLAVASVGAAQMLAAFGRLHETPSPAVVRAALLVGVPLLFAAGLTAWRQVPPSSHDD